MHVPTKDMPAADTACLQEICRRFSALLRLAGPVAWESLRQRLLQIGRACVHLQRCRTTICTERQTPSVVVATDCRSVHPDHVSPVLSGITTMSRCSTALSCGGLGTALSLALLAVPLPSQAQLLYKLETRCSLKGAEPVACTVAATNEANATLYRHQIGSEVVTLRISDAPVRMALWDAGSKQWQSLKRASARFSANTVCFNGRDLCVINPNYLNSVRETNPAATAKRDLVKVNFGEDGRINASCYDDGCEVTLK